MDSWVASTSWLLNNVAMSMSVQVVNANFKNWWAAYVQESQGDLYLTWAEKSLISWNQSRKLL